MSTRTKLGVTTLIILLTAGLWLIAAPFVVGYQPLNHPWTDATRNEVTTGATLAGLSFVALAVYAGDLLHDLTRRDTETPGR